MKKLANLFWAFFKVGLFTFGGGYAMLPMFKKELIENNKWISEQELLDCYAVSQCTPGVIAVNTATYVGAEVGGICGSIFATVGVIMPSLIIILILAAFLTNYSEIQAVRHAFAGIRVAVCALIIDAIIKLCKSTIKSAWSVLLAVSAFALSAIIGISSVWTVIGAVIIGLITAIITAKKGGEKK